MKKENICICVLAHNEERNITRTIESIIQGNRDLDYDLVVYANGCTDCTINVLENLAKVYPILSFVNIKCASKIHAWNVSFYENDHDILVYSDGDIILEPGAVLKIVEDLNSPGIIVSAGRQRPLIKDRGWQQKLVGIMQNPYMQEYLGGGFYGIRRKQINDALRRKQLSGIPEGITGEDKFIENVISKKEFHISEAVYLYEPPNFKDYCLYLSRLRWQSEQLEKFFRKYFHKDRLQNESFVRRIFQKAARSQSLKALLLGAGCISLRILFKIGAYSILKKNYRMLGPVTPNGANILTKKTRALSAK
jgi:glycosyltransferase involved in cell wall biosynthesis